MRDPFTFIKKVTELLVFQSRQKIAKFRSFIFLSSSLSSGVLEVIALKIIM